MRSMPSLLFLQHWVSDHPDLARACVAGFVFLVMYAVRKLFPNVWLFFERMSPALSAEMTWLDEQLHKLWQAVPSALLGGLVAPAMFGADFKQTLLGMLTGLVAPFSHELLKRYQGRLGTGKQGPGGPSGQKPVGVTGAGVGMFDDVTPPSLPGAAMRGLVLGLCAALFVGCGAHVNWPKVAQCGAPLEQPLLETVASVLAGTGDVKSELEQIALTKGAGAVECAVQQIVSDLGTAPVTARASHSAARGRAFLESVRQ